MPSFRATLLLKGKTATGISVPEDVVEALGSGKRPRVTVTIGSYAYRSTVAPMGGEFLVPVSAEVRAAAGVEAGEELDVTLELDTAPRVIEVPDDLAAALVAAPEAKAFWDTLSYSHQRAHVDSINGAKAAETRQRRIEKSVTQLRAGKK